MIGQYLALLMSLLLNSIFLIWRCGGLYHDSPLTNSTFDEDMFSVKSDLVSMNIGKEESIMFSLSWSHFSLIVLSNILLLVGFRYDRNDVLAGSGTVVLIDWVIVAVLAGLSYYVDSLFIFYMSLAHFPLSVWWLYFLYLCRCVEFGEEDSGEKNDVELTKYSDGDDKPNVSQA